MTMTGVIVVTGATGDIGRTTRAQLEADGYRTVGIDLAGDESEGLFRADLAEPRAVSEVFATIAAENGRLFGLVNCAGVYEALDAATTTLPDFERIWRGNVVTAWLASQSFAEYAQDGARIVNLASISGQHGSLDVAYGAAKGGVLALTKSLALHLAPRIRVNAVAPGVVDGSMASRIPGDRLESYRSSNLLKRLGRPEEIAHMISPLFGLAGAWTTGAVIEINGGIA
ncbi:SDR family NAD(P)-dependent oxidoreductase [Leifsonia sp. P73]|uniref:SDR family NAD(P)-dependent oxidoreductase n=1 Tax=Leifsonia sp. P73 TaxID=3423959 RepID=UPI003DA552BB